MELFWKKSGWRQTLSLIPVFVQLFLCGVTLGWLPVAVYYLRPASSTNEPVDSSSLALSLSSQQESWLASFQQLGRFVVTVPICLVTDVIGRKYVVLMAGAVYTIGWLAAFAVYTVEGIYLSNFFIGLALGIANTVCQIYTAEIASASLRGIFHAVNSFAYNLGYVVIGLLGVYFDYRRMAFIIFVCTFVSFLPSYWIMEESPYYLLYNGLDERALNTLQRLRINRDNSSSSNNNSINSNTIDDTVKDEYDKMIEVVRCQRGRNSLKRLIDSFKDPVNRKSIGLVLFLNSVAAFSGFLTIRLKSTDIVPVTRLVDSAVRYPMIIACVQLCSSLASPFLIEKFPRRILYIVSSCTMTIVLFVTGIVFHYAEEVRPTITTFNSSNSSTFNSSNSSTFNSSKDDGNRSLSDYLDNVLVVLILLYYVVYSLTLITLLFVSKGELLPQNARAAGSGLTALSQAAASGLSIIQYEFVRSTVGVYFNFFVFAVASASIGLVVYFYLPETRCMTLAAIQHCMNNNNNNNNTDNIDRMTSTVSKSNKK